MMKPTTRPRSRKPTDQDEKLRYVHLLSIQRLAAGVVEEHDTVFKTLFK